MLTFKAKDNEGVSDRGGWSEVFSKGGNKLSSAQASLKAAGAKVGGVTVVMVVTKEVASTIVDTDCDLSATSEAALKV